MSRIKKTSCAQGCSSYGAHPQQRGNTQGLDSGRADEEGVAVTTGVATSFRFTSRGRG